MDLQDLGNIGEFVGAIGVIVSLIYLGYQIKQNSGMIRDNTVQILLTNSVNAAQQGNSEEFRRVFAKLRSGEHLSDEETRFAGTILYSMLMQHDNAYYQYYRGNLDDGVWSSYRARNLRILNMPFFIEWWPDNKEVYSTYFQDYVDDQIQRIEADA